MEIAKLDAKPISFCSKFVLHTKGRLLPNFQSVFSEPEILIAWCSEMEIETLPKSSLQILTLKTFDKLQFTGLLEKHINTVRKTNVTELFEHLNKLPHTVKAEAYSLITGSHSMVNREKLRLVENARYGVHNKNPDKQQQQLFLRLLKSEIEPIRPCYSAQDLDVLLLENSEKLKVLPKAKLASRNKKTIRFHKNEEEIPLLTKMKRLVICDGLSVNGAAIEVLRDIPYGPDKKLLDKKSLIKLGKLGNGKQADIDRLSDHFKEKMALREIG